MIVTVTGTLSCVVTRKNLDRLQVLACVFRQPRNDHSFIRYDATAASIVKLFSLRDHIVANVMSKCKPTMRTSAFAPLWPCAADVSDSRIELLATPPFAVPHSRKQHACDQMGSSPRYLRSYSSLKDNG